MSVILSCLLSILLSIHLYHQCPSRQRAIDGNSQSINAQLVGAEMRLMLLSAEPNMPISGLFLPEFDHTAVEKRQSWDVVNLLIRVASCVCPQLTEV